MKKDILRGAILFLLLNISSHAAEQLTIGVVPQFDARQLRTTWQPIIDAVEQNSGLKITLIQKSSIPAFEQSFIKGEFDLVYLNPYHLIVANRAQGYYPILKDQAAKLEGIIVVRNEGPYKTMKDLENSTIAFPAPNALGASLLTRADLTNKFGIHFTPRYVGNHDSVYLNVALGLVSAGGGVYGTLYQQKQEVQQALTVIHTTRPSPKHPVAVHPRVNKAHVVRFENAMMDIANSTQGQALLKSIPIATLGKADLSEYLFLRDAGIDSLAKEKNTK